MFGRYIVRMNPGAGKNKLTKNTPPPSYGSFAQQQQQQQEQQQFTPVYVVNPRTYVIPYETRLGNTKYNTCRYVKHTGIKKLQCSRVVEESEVTFE